MQERRTRVKEKKNTKSLLLIILLVMVIIIAGVLLVLKLLKDQDAVIDANTNTAEEQQEEVRLPKTFAGTDRAIAIMIDNHIDAMPQAGLLEADLVYEIIVEGGETRLMTVLKGKTLDKIGPVRSSRHYFLDYALENDAIYVHFGWSPKAQSDISSLGVNNINGIYESSSSFWRTTDKYAPHNVATSTKDILTIAKRKEYKTTSTKESVLNYVVDEVNLESDTVANTVTIPYSDYNTVKYTYNEEKKNYTRYSRGEKQVEWVTGKTVTTKNIIITFCENYTLSDGSGKGRQTIENIGTLDGYYITNGKAIKITCTKSSRKAQTVYKDLQGNVIDVNDGKTFVQICPINAKVKITE